MYVCNWMLNKYGFNVSHSGFLVSVCRVTGDLYGLLYKYRFDRKKVVNLCDNITSNDCDIAEYVKNFTCIYTKLKENEKKEYNLYQSIRKNFNNRLCKELVNTIYSYACVFS